MPPLRSEDSQPARMTAGKVAGFRAGSCSLLAQLRRDARECGVQLRAEAVDHCNDRNRNAGSDEAVLDRGGARIVLQKREQHFHSDIPQRVFVGLNGGDLTHKS